MPEWIAILISALIGAAVIAVIACTGAAVAWGRIKQTLINSAEKFTAVSIEISDVKKKFSKEIESVKRGLYKDDGTLVYVPADECEKRRADCDKIHASNSANVCRKIEELGKDLQEDREKREAEAKELSERLRLIEIDMAKLAGREEGNSHA